MPATALSSETATPREATSAERDAGASRRSIPNGSVVDLDDFAAAWEARSTRAERDRLSAAAGTKRGQPTPTAADVGPDASSLKLGADAVSEETVCSWTLEEFAASGLAVKVESSLLDDTIWLLADAPELGDEPAEAVADLSQVRVPVNLDKDDPTYRTSELEGLLGLDTRPLRDLHRLKRAFGVRFGVEGLLSNQEPLGKASDEIPLEWLESTETVATTKGPNASEELPSEDSQIEERDSA